LTANVQTLALRLYANKEFFNHKFITLDSDTPWMLSHQRLNHALQRSSVTAILGKSGKNASVAGTV
jgi:hypothetical protein